MQLRWVHVCFEFHENSLNMFQVYNMNTFHMFYMLQPSSTIFFLEMVTSKILSQIWSYVSVTIQLKVSFALTVRQ